MNRKILAVFLIIAAVAAASVGYLIFKPDTSLPKNPSDFNFIFKYGVMAKNELNTFNQTFTKDMIVDAPITIELKLTDDEMESVYDKIRSSNLFSAAGAKINENIMVTPCDNYYLMIQTGDIQRELLWNDCHGEIKDQRKKFTDYIKQIIFSKEEYKKLPEPQGGYI